MRLRAPALLLFCGFCLAQIHAVHLAFMFRPFASPDVIKKWTEYEARDPDGWVHQPGNYFLMAMQREARGNSPVMCARPPGRAVLVVC